ncbi:MAG: hypothetical protein CMF70_06990 [Magnetovibrio sp.]|nr:hypothetical protein [Magnetovibrio sp.]
MIHEPPLIRQDLMALQPLPVLQVLRKVFAVSLIPELWALIERAAQLGHIFKAFIFDRAIAVAYFIEAI